jgi:hypothetical protein
MNMKKKIVMMLCGIGFVLISHSQTIKGKLVDLVDSRPLAGATLTLSSAKDSLKSKFAVSDSSGVFRFDNLDFDTYYVQVAFIGYEKYRQLATINDSTPSLDLGTIFVPKTSTTMTGITVTAKTPPAQQKGDTIQYNASQFKVNPDATVEDLVKKAPGITVDRDGTVTAQGEQVRKVTIDGRDFFGDDASAALRNLPAEIVDKIQVFDRLTDQAQFTGVDDGNAQKAINIVTKSGMQNGQFGRVYAGYGTDDRYNAGGNMSFFKKDRRISIVGLTNNVNQQNFGSQDLLGLTSSGGRGGGRGGWGGGGGGFTIGQQSGISRTNALGINYSDRWGKKIQVSGSYFFNNSNLNNDRLTNSQSLAKPDSILFSDENSISRTNNYNHRVNFRMEYEIDSNNTIIVTPNISWQKNKARTTTDQLNYYNLATGQLSELLNSRNSVNDGVNFNNNFLYRHRFGKRGRTISLNVNTSFNNRDGETFQESYATYFGSGGKNDTLEQYTSNITKGRTVSTNIVYTEPIGKKGSLQLNYNPSFTSNKADQETFRFDNVTDKYSIFDTTLSNVFDNTYNRQNAGITYRVGDRDMNFSVGVNYQSSKLESEQIFPNRTNIDRGFRNVLPSMFFRMKLSAKSNIRLFYRTSVDPPSVNQLQNVINITNPLRVSTGNAELDQEYTHRFGGRYTFTNTRLGQSFFANVFAQMTNDYVTNAIYTAFQDSVLAPGIILYRGSQLTKPVNLDGYWSVRSFFTFGQPINAIKSNINLNAGLSYSTTPGLANGVKTKTEVYNYSAGAVIASNISEYVDFNISYSANFNQTRNEQQPQLNQNYVTQVAGMQFNLLSKSGWFLQNDLSNQTFTGLTEGYNPSFWLWNMAVGKKIFKNRRGELKASVFDLLKQNQSVSRNVSGLEIVDERNTVLQQYFMLTFTYSLKNFGKANTGRQNGNRGNWGGPGGPGGGPRPNF